MDKRIKEIQEHAQHPDTVVKLSWAWNLTGGGLMHGVQLYGPRKKKLGPFLVVNEGYPNTPAGALRSLADILEVSDGPERST